MVGEWIRNVFIKKAICNILLLSLIPTKRNLLSTIFDGPPLSPARERGCILHVCGHWHSYGLMVCEGSEIISSDAVQNGKSPEIINLLLSVIYCKFEPGRDAEVVPE